MKWRRLEARLPEKGNHLRPQRRAEDEQAHDHGGHRADEHGRGRHLFAHFRQRVQVGRGQGPHGRAGGVSTNSAIHTTPTARKIIAPSTGFRPSQRLRAKTAAEASAWIQALRWVRIMCHQPAKAWRKEARREVERRAGERDVLVTCTTITPTSAGRKYS